MKDLKRRIIDISYKNKLSHLSSCLTSLPIIQEIYEKKRENDRFILSNGHAGLALYVVLEDLYGFNAEKLLEKHGIHPGFDIDHKIFCSTGSLGSGLPIAVGYALSSPERDVYCLISDGESSEGSVWESLRFIYAKGIKNIFVYANVNGTSATEFLDGDYLCERLKVFLPRIEIRHTNVREHTFLNGIIGHYYIMKDKDYEKAIRVVTKE